MISHESDLQIAASIPKIDLSPSESNLKARTFLVLFKCEVVVFFRQSSGCPGLIRTGIHGKNELRVGWIGLSGQQEENRWTHVVAVMPNCDVQFPLRQVANKSIPNTPDREPHFVAAELAAHAREVVEHATEPRVRRRVGRSRPPGTVVANDEKCIIIDATTIARKRKKSA